MLEVVLSISYVVLLGLFFYVIGHFLRCLFSTGSDCGEFEIFFMDVSIGGLFSVFIYAFLHTHGLTILTGCILPIVVIYVFNFKSLRCRFKSTRPLLHVFWTFLIASVLLSLVGFVEIKSFIGKLYEANQDYAFYSNVSYYINCTGVESNGVDIVNREFACPNFYRYPELWLTAMIRRFCSMSLYYILTTITFPFLAALSVIGMGSVLERYLKIKDRHLMIVSFVIVCLTVVYFQYYADSSKLIVAPLKYSSLTLQRFYPTLIAFIFVFLSKDTYVKVSALCVSTFLNMTIIAPVLAGISFYLIIEAFRGSYKNREYWISVLIFTISAIYSVCFYIFTGVANPYISDTPSLWETFRFAMSQFGVFSILQYIMLPLSDLVVNTLPYIMILFLLKKDKRKNMLHFLKDNYLLWITLLLSIFGFSSIWYVRDSVQIYYATAYPLFLIVNSFSLVFVFINGNLVSRILVLLIIVVNIMFLPNGDYNRGRELDKGFYESIALSIKSDPTENRFAWIDFDELRTNPSVLIRDVNYRKPLHELSRFVDNYSPVRLDVFDVEYNPTDVLDRSVTSSIENNSFYRYVLKHKMERNREEAQRRYIIDNRIRYLIVPRGSNWVESNNFKVNKVIESDTESYSFYIIDGIQNEY